jgi:hypothetical protein
LAGHRRLPFELIRATEARAVREQALVVRIAAEWHHNLLLVLAESARTPLLPSVEQ